MQLAPHGRRHGREPFAAGSRRPALEIGRAGRDGAPARTLALFDPRELALRWRAPAIAPENEAAAGDYARRKAMARLCVTPGCHFQTLLAEFGEESAPCGRCDHCRGGPLARPRRARALSLGWRVAAESRLTHFWADDAVEDALPDPPATETPVFAPAPEIEPPLTIADARLLRALQKERLEIAKRLGVPPKQVATDDVLRKIALARPSRPDDPLLAGVREASAFLRALKKNLYF